MLKKLRIKFICIIMSLVSILLCIIFSILIHSARQRLEQESFQALHNAANDPGFFYDHLKAPSSLPYFVMRQDLWGNLKISGTIYYEQYSAEELADFWNTAVQSDGKEHTLREYNLKYLKIESPVGIRCAFVDISSHNIVMDSMLGVSLSVGIMSFSLLLGVSILLAWWVVKPVEKAWTQQRQFIADASHELKTPLTVIMTNAELLQNPDCEPEQRQQFHRSILTMSHQMRNLVEGLLDLARVDNGSVKLSFAPLDLSCLISEGLLPFEPVFYEKGLTLLSEIEPGIRCKGSEPHLRQVLEILLDNALKYSFPNSEVTVRLERHGIHILFSVTSFGESISPEDQKNIFKRFYRIDKARTRTGSYGLGLSIAQQIVVEHRGRIWVESKYGRNAFFVQLSLL